MGVWCVVCGVCCEYGYGCVGVCVGVCGCVWVCVGVCGCVWVCVGVVGVEYCVWPVTNSPPAPTPSSPDASLLSEPHVHSGKGLISFILIVPTFWKSPPL
jgi:hypothetical protein